VVGSWGPRGVVLGCTGAGSVLVTLDPPSSFVYSYWTVRASHDPRLSVGLIGLGNMGTAIAERLLEAGHELVVYNRTPEKATALGARGAVVAETPADLIEQVDVVLTSLADDDALEAVSREVIPTARPGTVLVDMSTVSPAASARVASLAEAASVAYLRAPVSGNPSVVRAGNLSFIVSGPRATLDRVEPVLRAIGPTVHHVGEEEQARVVKLAINLMIAGLAQLMSEALVLGEAAGVSRASLLEVMSTSAVGAPFVKYKTEPLLRDDFSATFTTALMEKDIDLVLDAAEEAGVELPVATEMKTLLRAAIEAGYSDNDFMALFLHLRSAAPLTRVGDHPDQEVVR
jgi:3-hydroxyisobutyrate dehydrogenase-like beta-hydroxyacid dehydrogenase